MLRYRRRIFQIQPIINTLLGRVHSYRFYRQQQHRPSAGLRATPVITGTHNVIVGYNAQANAATDTTRPSSKA
jgi:hypothetical protein